MDDSRIHYIINDVENAFDRWRWVLIWTPFGPVLITDSKLIGWLTTPPYMGDEDVGKS